MYVCVCVYIYTRIYTYKLSYCTISYVTLVQFMLLRPTVWSDAARPACGLTRFCSDFCV